MQIRDRIRELRRVPARELRANPRNWRTHPQRQREALAGVLAVVADIIFVHSDTKLGHFRHNNCQTPRSGRIPPVSNVVWTRVKRQADELSPPTGRDYCHKHLVEKMPVCDGPPRDCRQRAA